MKRVRCDTYASCCRGKFSLSWKLWFQFYNLKILYFIVAFDIKWFIEVLAVGSKLCEIHVLAQISMEFSNKFHCKKVSVPPDFDLCLKLFWKLESFLLHNEFLL